MSNVNDSVQRCSQLMRCVREELVFDLVTFLQLLIQLYNFVGISKILFEPIGRKSRNRKHDIQRIINGHVAPEPPRCTP
ncbi:hypothetical protein D3C73_1592700 [compost metagenome]